jgi:aspartyl-tRNA(Asn)/glutamyl-tRNA(Gln) amidotransferase subunit C
MNGKGSIDRALIRHVAELASLSLTEAEGEKLTQEIGAILGYISELDSLDTSNVPPTAQVALGHDVALRSDVVLPCLSHEDALAQAPRAAQGGFAVPAFVEGGAAETSRRGQT